MSNKQELFDAYVALMTEAMAIRQKLYYGSGRFRASFDGHDLVNRLGAVLQVIDYQVTQLFDMPEENNEH
jgi:hypothetical protein